MMFTQIRKRDGRLAPFDPAKISAAIAKAGEASGEFEREEANKLSLKVLALVQARLTQEIPTVEAIQDVVEEVLLASPYRRTAKAYIIYREQHARMRDMVNQANVDLIDQYLGELDWQVHENSNTTFSLQGLNNYISSEICKTYWLSSIYPKSIREAYLSGDLHIHDLNSLSVYCVGWDLMDLLVQGFRGVPGKIASGPPKHFSSALGQIVNFFYTLQGEAAGAQAFSSIDTLLAPFIRYDGLNYAQVRQAMQEFIFNLNVPTRVGFQTPFTNITLDLTPSAVYRDMPVIIGGKPQAETYGDFQAEMDLFNRAFCDVMLQGDASGRVFTFPIPTYNITRDFDWENPNLDLLWEVTAKYGLPYFSNFINSDMNPEDARSMCCRLRLDNRELNKRGGGLFGANPLTGSIGVVTLNMPRLGYLAKDKADFFERLERLMRVAKESLDIKRKILEKLTRENLYPYARFYLRDIYQRNGKFWMNHFGTIGLLGMNEACLNLLGQDIGSAVGRTFAEETLAFMREKLSEFQEQSGHLYNLEATPGEGTAYRMARADKKLYPEIRVANEACYRQGAEPFYSNSTQLPVQYTENLFEALDLQDKLQTQYTGGTVFHMFTGERASQPQLVRELVRRVCHHYHLPYFTFTPTFSVCVSHGYLPGEHAQCPSCGGRVEVYSRVVGYLRPVGQWNDGKQAEFSVRKTYALQPTNAPAVDSVAV